MSNPDVQETTPSFDDLWAAENGETSQTTGAAQEQTDPDAVAATAATQTQEAGSGGEGGDKTGSGEAAAAPDSTAATTTTAETDWIASLPDDVQERIREERKAAEDRYKALHGKVAPMQRQVNELQRRLAQPAPAPAAASTSAAQDDSYFDSDEWKRYEADFPGDAKVIRAGIERQQKAVAALEAKVEARLQQLDRGVQAVTARDAEADLEAQINALTEKHPDWQEINASDQFWEWFDGYRAQQPGVLRDALYDEKKVNELFRDATWTAARISEYKAATGYTAPSAAAATTTATATTPAATTERTQPAQTAGARLRMAAAPDVRSTGAPRTSVPLDSLSPAEQFETLWNATN
jgi:hypothetical protein